MRSKLLIALIFGSIILTQINPNEGQQNRPQLPVSVLDEILKANNNNNNNGENPNNGLGNNDPLSMIISSLGPIMANLPDNSGNSGSTGTDNNTGIGVLDFFRNMIAMLLRAVLQVFKFFQLLSRAITGGNGKKLAFLSNEEKTSNLSDNEISDKSNERLERVLRQIQSSAEEFPLNFFVSDEKAIEFENQIKDVFEMLPNYRSDSMETILKSLKSDSFISNFKSGLNSIYRNKRQNIEELDDNYKAINIPLNSLLDQFVESHSQLNTDFHFEFPTNKK